MRPAAEPELVIDDRAPAAADFYASAFIIHPVSGRKQDFPVTPISFYLLTN
jgi:hypothetical protein